MGKTLLLLPPSKLQSRRESTGNIASAGRDENESGNRIPRCSFCVSLRFILFMQSKFSIQSSAKRIDLSERESLSGKTVADRSRRSERDGEREQLRFDENPLRLARALPSTARRPYNRPHS